MTNAPPFPDISPARVAAAARRGQGQGSGVCFSATEIDGQPAVMMRIESEIPMELSFFVRQPEDLAPQIELLELTMQASSPTGISSRRLEENALGIAQVASTLKQFLHHLEDGLESHGPPPSHRDDPLARHRMSVRRLERITTALDERLHKDLPPRLLNAVLQMEPHHLN